VSGIDVDVDVDVDRADVMIENVERGLVVPTSSDEILLLRPSSKVVGWGEPSSSLPTDRDAVPDVRRLSSLPVAVGSSTVFPWPVRTREEFLKLENVGNVDEETESVMLFVLPEVLTVTPVLIVEDGSLVLLDLEALEALSDSLDVTALPVVNFCVAVFIVFVVFFASSFDAFVGFGVGLGVFLGLSLVAFAFVDFGFFLVLLSFLDFGFVGFLVFLGGLGSATSPDLAFLGPKARHLEKSGHSLDYVCVSQNMMSPM
jgi:hypothetical protein